MQKEPLPLLETGDEGSADSVSSCVDIDVMSAMGQAPGCPASQQPSTSAARMQPEPLPLWAAGDEGSADSVSSSVDTEVMGYTSSAARSRPFSPEPSTSSARMQLILQPFVKAGDAKWTDPVSSGDAKDYREKRPWSPQPSTSSAAMMMQRELQPVFEPDDTMRDYMYARDLSMRRSPMISWQSRPSSPQPSTSSATMQMEPLVRADDAKSRDYLDFTFSPAPQNTSIPASIRCRRWSTSSVVQKPPEMETLTKTEEESSSQSGAQNFSSPPVKNQLRRWPPQKLISAAERLQLEMQGLMQPDCVTPADYNLSSIAQNLSIPAAGKKRPWSPQPSTSKAAMQLDLMPLMEPVDARSDSFSQTVAQNISAIVDERDRSLSPQPSTSAQMQPASLERPGDAVFISPAQNISGSVGEGDRPSTSVAATMEIEPPPSKKSAQNPASYAHVKHNISNIPQLRGLKAGRRHGRLRRLNIQNKMNEKYGPVIEYIGPMVAEESAKQQTHQILIASALDHFANTINQIADKYEGKEDTTGLTERLEEFKKKADERREKRRKRNPNASEEPPLPRPPSPPKLSEEEINRRLREETEAAVEALMTGDRSKECPPDRFAEIIKSFNEAFYPSSK